MSYIISPPIPPLRILEKGMPTPLQPSGIFVLYLAEEDKSARGNETIKERITFLSIFTNLLYQNQWVPWIDKVRTQFQNFQLIGTIPSF